jgi:hypothetical protein
MSVIQAIITNPILGGIATFAGLILAIVSLYFNPFTRKRLTVGIVSSTALVAVDTNEGLTSRSGKDLDIKYGGHSVTNLYMTLIRVRNTGYVNIDLTQRSIEPPITITFESKIFAFGTVKKDSQTGNADLKFRNEHSVTLTTLLLDKKDQFLFKVISDQKITDFKDVDYSPYIKTYRPEKRHEFPNEQLSTAVSISGYALSAIFFLASFFLYIYIHYSNQPDIMPFAILLSVITIIYLSVLLHDIANDLMRWITRKHV